MLQRARDLGLLIKGKTSLVVLETHQEDYALQLLQRELRQQRRTLYRWTLTDGLAAAGFGPQIGVSGQKLNAEEVLESIKSRNEGGVFMLCDFHPFLTDNPKIVRLIKDIALGKVHSDKTLVFVSHRLELPAELKPYSVSADLALPDEGEIMQLIRNEAKRWSKENGGGRIKTDGKALQLLAGQMQGLPHQDVSRLAYHAIADDGAITHEDIPALHQAKFDLLNQDGLLHFEFDTEEFAKVGGLHNLKQWLLQRRTAFVEQKTSDSPKGVLLLGVQGGGKSLAAKAIAGLWNLPLLRLEMGALYNKYIGETERNLRETLAQAEVMSPCVLWLDEIEKALSQSSDDNGMSRRLLGYLLTWMAERKAPVFMVATSNDIQSLPAELVRKGRFDEIFFVDLPDAEVREEIFMIHLQKRDLNVNTFDVAALAMTAEDFSGAEIEQAIVAALYTAEAEDRKVDTAAIQCEIEKTTPLAVVMAEQLMALRHWASERTVPA
ncbi:AAA family ATPase [Maricurvus nonylphenolicus]|uniref:AAA family ATPase n=1 Tax=Maricurvus nonylphenolicus TaxID=1008307 RepID=UPI0036F3B1BD